MRNEENVVDNVLSSGIISDCVQNLCESESERNEIYQNILINTSEVIEEHLDGLNQASDTLLPHHSISQLYDAILG